MYLQLRCVLISSGRTQQLEVSHTSSAARCTSRRKSQTARMCDLGFLTPGVDSQPFHGVSLFPAGFSTFVSLRLTVKLREHCCLQCVAATASGSEVNHSKEMTSLPALGLASTAAIRIVKNSGLDDHGPTQATRLNRFKKSRHISDWPESGAISTAET